MVKKYTRKQLRKPDEFISISMRLWEVVRRHASRVVAMFVVAVLITGGVWTWSYFAEAKAAKATGTLSRAFDIYNQTVFPTVDKLPPAEDGIPRFRTRDGKLKAADKEFSKALDEAGGKLGAMTLLMRASVRFDQRRYKEALKDYQDFLSKSDDKGYRYLAQEGIAYCHEGQKALDKALSHFRKLPRDGERKWAALYHEARILAKQGKKKDAAKLLRQVIDKALDKTLVNRASDHLAQLEG